MKIPPNHLAKEEVKMKSLLRLLLKSQHQQNRSRPAQTEKGMTLVELLVGAIMAFLIITPMLGFVVDMLNTDRREQVKSNTEQDIQAATDFIAQDLSQAIYIYDNIDISGGTRGNVTVTAIRNKLPVGNGGTPILVFWKRQLQKNAIPLAKLAQPKGCLENTVSGTGACNDTYVLSLVAYYQVSDGNATWCQPSGGTCPTRIVRYQIRDGLKDPNKGTVADPYYTDVKEGQERSTAYNPKFDISNPTKDVTLSPDWGSSEVLVNYIDHSSGPTLTGDECKTALGNPRTTDSSNVLIGEDTLKVTDKTTNINSFYACVDTQRNLARVTIRGNSLRRLQTDADYDAKKSAFFPTASVQVQGLGARGK